MKFSRGRDGEKERRDRGRGRRRRGGAGRRDGDRRGAGNTDALYDLAADPREQANLARRRPGILKALAARWEEINKDLLPYE